MRTLGIFFLLNISTMIQAQEYYLLAGTYNSPKSSGIHVYRFNSGNGSAKEVSHIALDNPSYLTTTDGGRFVYAVLENANNGNGGEVAAMTFDKENGTLQLINKQSTGGDHPCYIEMDKTGRWVFVANYTSGNIAVFEVDTIGGLNKASSIIQFEGRGPDTARQKGPHAHATVISPDNKWLYVTDLGSDRIWTFGFDEESGKLTRSNPPGIEIHTGPRHFTFHPNNKYAYLLNEISGTIVVFKVENGKLSQVQEISNREKGDERYPASADIHVSADGKFLYASNRADINTIGIYNINEKDGKLTRVGMQDTKGMAPRNFNFDPHDRFLLAANMRTDEIVIFTRDRNTGLLNDSGKRISIGKPVCLKWIPIK